MSDEENGYTGLELAQLDDRTWIERLLNEPMIVFAETLTGALSQPSLVRFALGKCVQARLKGRLIQEFGIQLRVLREAGKIKEDYFATHSQQATLKDFLKFIDDDPPDEEVFKALKSIFFCGVEKSATAADELKAYHLLQVCKQLRSAEILLLRESWSLYKEDPKQMSKWRATENEGVYEYVWLQKMSASLKLPEGLIENSAETLNRLRLLRPSKLQGIISAETCRLSTFGIELCERITKFP